MKLTPKQRLTAIAKIIEDLYGRCMPIGGPATKSRDEITCAEIRIIYDLAKGSHAAPKESPNA